MFAPFKPGGPGSPGRHEKISMHQNSENKMNLDQALEEISRLRQLLAAQGAGDDESLDETDRLRRTLKRRERDNRMLLRLHENSELLRQVYEREKKLQYLYTDLLMKNSPNIIFLFNENLRYVLGSQSHFRLIDQTHTLMLDKTMDQIFVHSEVDTAWVAKIHRQSSEVLRERKAIRYDDVLRVGGKVMNAQVSISPIVDDKEQCRGIILAIDDVSELVEARRKAEAAARSKGRFLANMSHEIRTPLNAIKGLSELLMSSQLNDVQYEYLDNILGAANSLINIVNDILDYSKIDEGRIEIIEEEYSTSGLLGEIFTVLGLRAEEKGLTLLTDVDPALPARLWGDEPHIKQILMNILSNAVKYTHHGNVKFSLTLLAREGGHYLEAIVEDSGIGIRGEELPTLFDAFTRADLHTNRNIMGTGLGLAISKQLAEAMNGKITVESVHGQGSRFIFEVPQTVKESRPLAVPARPGTCRMLLAGNDLQLEGIPPILDRLKIPHARLTDAGPPPDGAFTHCIYAESAPEQTVRKLKETMPQCRFAALRSIRNKNTASTFGDIILLRPLLITDLSRFTRSDAGTAGQASPRDNFALDGLKVQNVMALVVDDNDLNLLVCDRMLAKYGVMVVRAGGGEESVALCGEKKFDLIFMDHMMPGMDGLEAAHHIRSGQGLNNSTPLIALTANVISGMRNFYLDNGMDDFVPKPIDRAELCRVLARWLPAEKIVTQS
ncbi:hypothetical protein C4J81_00180 [Deltaproteobacteria bacterium Smac51]|nr:hypothetical protein C4J81_00180 [Deltaproteobacteria bacterium Smac51]